MNLLVPIWSMVAATCGTMALIQVFLWLNGGRQRRYLLPALSAAAATATAVVELLLFTSTTPHRYEQLLIWENLAVALVLVPMVWFLRAYLGTGRRWLALTITALWGIGLLINFALEGNLTFRSVESLQTLTAPWGERFVLAEGAINPWQWVANLASVLFAVYAMDASIQAWFMFLPPPCLLTGRR